MNFHPNNMPNLAILCGGSGVNASTLATAQRTLRAAYQVLEPAEAPIVVAKAGAKSNEQTKEAPRKDYKRISAIRDAQEARRQVKLGFDYAMQLVDVSRAKLIQAFITCDISRVVPMGKQPEHFGSELVNAFINGMWSSLGRKNHKGSSTPEGTAKELVMAHRSWMTYPYAFRTHLAQEIVSKIAGARREIKVNEGEGGPHWGVIDVRVIPSDPNVFNRLFSELVHGISVPEDFEGWDKNRLKMAWRQWANNEEAVKLQAKKELQLREMVNSEPSPASMTPHVASARQPQHHPIPQLKVIDAPKPPANPPKVLHKKSKKWPPKAAARIAH